MSLMPSFQDRVLRLDSAKDHGGWRPQPPLGCVWHETDGASAKSTEDYLNGPDKTASYNYIIERDGQIRRFLDPAFIAYHAGQKCTAGPPALRRGESVNGRTIGVAFANFGKKEHITYRQLESGLWLGKTLMVKYGYGSDMNVGHKEVAPGYKGDPFELDMHFWRVQLRSEWPTKIHLVAPRGAV